MYCEFYQMRERPFSVTADPKFLYLNARYREALASLHYGITQRKGFITLIGEAGTGKTTLLKKLLDDLDSKTRTVFVFNTNVSFDEILEYIFAEFDLPTHNGKRLYMLQRLNGFLLEELRNGRNVALLIDEAQDLDYSVLEDLRLLSNLETAKEKILQIVLSGQPELGQKLANPGLRQLRQRIAINCRLLPLAREEITQYIGSRLTAAGGTDPHLFTRDAEERIYEISTGIPRLVNIVCDNALVIGYALGKKRITADVVSEAAADLLSLDARAPAPEIPEVPAPAVIAAAPARGRRFSQVGVVAVVVAAIVIGLLSVGRSLLSRENTASGPVPARPPLEVKRPGVGNTEAAGPRVSDVSPSQGVRDATDARAALPAEGRAVARAPGAVAPPAAESDPPRDTRSGLQRSQPGVAAPDPARSDPPLAARPALDGYAPPRAGVGNGSDYGAETLDPRVPGRPPSQEPRTDPGRSGRLDDPAVPYGQAVDDQRLAAAPRPAPAARDMSSGTLMMPPRTAPGRDGDATARSWDAPAEDASAESEPRDSQEFTVASQRFEAVRVRPGDSVSALATRKYGQASYTILDLMRIANPGLRDVNVISVGRTLRLPELDDGLVLLRQSDRRYAILLMTTPIPRMAKDIETALRRRGLGAEVRQSRFGNGETVYRLFIADLPSREAALAAGDRVQRIFREDERIAAMAR